MAQLLHACCHAAYACTACCLFHAAVRRPPHYRIQHDERVHPTACICRNMHTKPTHIFVSTQNVPATCGKAHQGEAQVDHLYFDLCPACFREALMRVAQPQKLCVMSPDMVPNGQCIVGISDQVFLAAESCLATVSAVHLSSPPSSQDGSELMLTLQSGTLARKTFISRLAPWTAGQQCQGELWTAQLAMLSTTSLL